MKEGILHHRKKSIFNHVEPKISFWLGFGLVIVIFFIIGFFVLLGNFVKQLENSTESDIKDSALVENVNQEPTQPISPPSPRSTSVTVAEITDFDHILGSNEALVSVIEYSDLECPFCSRFHGVMKQIVQDYNGKVNWVYRHFPLESLHHEARPAAIASECAGEQGKFWEFIDTVFENQSSMNSKYYTQVATQLGLDLDKFDSCNKSGKYDNLITQQAAQARAAGGSGTPHSIIVSGNTTIPVRGAVSITQLKAMIDPLLGGK